MTKSRFLFTNRDIIFTYSIEKKTGAILCSSSANTLSRSRSTGDRQAGTQARTHARTPTDLPSQTNGKTSNTTEGQGGGYGYPQIGTDHLRDSEHANGPCQD